MEEVMADGKRPIKDGDDVEFGPFRFVGWHCQLEWKPQDLWVGAFWKRTGNCVDLWICLLPCVPIHVSWWWSREP